MSTASNNPYSRGYAAIWAALNAWPAWTGIVRPGNRINEQARGFQPPAPNKSAPGDRGEVQLLEQRLGIQPFTGNSTGIFFRASYSLQIASGKYGPDLMNLMVIESARALMAIDTQKNLLGISDILDKWDFAPDASARPRDPASSRPEWATALTVMLSFSMRRADFMSATFT